MPNLHEQRIVELPPNEHRGAWFVVETWDDCDCPDCNAEGHWYRSAGMPTRAEAERILRPHGR